MLIPRPETEEWAIKVARMIQAHRVSQRKVVPSASIDRPDHLNPFTVLDIGSGSGCLSLLLADHNRTARVVGADISTAALDLAKENEQAMHARWEETTAGHLWKPEYSHAQRVAFVAADLFRESFPGRVNSALSALRMLQPESPAVGKGTPNRPQPSWHREKGLDPGPAGFDMIVSNPPYISRSDYADLDLSVRDWESQLALVGERPGSAIITPERSASLEGSKTGKTATELLSSLKLGPGEDDRDDGLAFYRRLIHLLKHRAGLETRLLRPHIQGSRPYPRVALEVGQGQAEQVKDMLLQAQIPEIQGVSVWNDFRGIPRVVLGWHNHHDS